jgi:hypothetical protein
MRGCADSVLISMIGCFAESAGIWVYVMLLLLVVVDADAASL